jgi:hypothetical protein
VKNENDSGNEEDQEGEFMQAMFYDEMEEVGDDDSSNSSINSLGFLQ